MILSKGLCTVLFIGITALKCGGSDDSTVNQKLLVVADPGKEEEVLTRLSRVGYDKTIGFSRRF